MIQRRARLSVTLGLLALAAGFAGCDDAPDAEPADAGGVAPAGKRPVAEARKGNGPGAPRGNNADAVGFCQAMADATRNCLKSSDAVSPALKEGFAGRPVDPAAAERGYQEGMRILDEELSRVHSTDPPDTPSGRAFHEAVIRFIEGHRSRLTTTFREILPIARDEGLTPQQKRAQADPIFDRIEREEQEQFKGVQETQDVFARENRIILQKPS